MKETMNISVWEENYRTAHNFFKKHGHFPTNKEDRRIRQWANVWFHKHSEKYPDKLQMLLSIGYPIPDRWNLWNRNYKYARDFLLEHGRPMKHSDNNKVWRYFRVWACNSGKRYPERVHMLREIGITLKVMDSVWQKNFDRASNFYKTHGHFPTKSENILLYEWARQWEQRMGRDNPSMLDMLKSIGYIPQHTAAG